MSRVAINRSLGLGAAGIPTKRPRRQKEASLSDAIREALACEQGLVLWRNSVGSFHAHGGGRVWAGLPRGSADLVGLLLTKVYLVGSVAQGDGPAREFGRFIALEVKRPGEVPTSVQIARAWSKAADKRSEAERHVLEQEAWLAEVRQRGGFAAYVDGVEDARAAIARARGGATS